MPINGFVNSSSSYDIGNKIDTSLMVQQQNLRSNFIEANIEEDTDLKIKIELKNYQILYQLKNLLVRTMLIKILLILV